MTKIQNACRESSQAFAIFLVNFNLLFKFQFGKFFHECSSFPIRTGEGGKKSSFIHGLRAGIKHKHRPARATKKIYSLGTASQKSGFVNILCKKKG